MVEEVAPEINAKMIVDLEVVLDENGNPVLDEGGKPVVRSLLTGKIVTGKESVNDKAQTDER